MPFNQNSWYGQALFGAIMTQVWPVFGNVLVVCPAGDANYNALRELFETDPYGAVRFFTTLDAAYEAARNNANDVILLSANTTHTLTAGINWTKSRVHVIGMDGGNRLVQQGAKVSTSSTDTTA